MNNRRCPYCNEYVPSTSITCPRCYKQIPPDKDPVRKEDVYNTDGTIHKQPKQRNVDNRTAMLLALIPGLVGLLGLGLLYRDPRNPRGWSLLALGLAIFCIVNAMLFLTVGLSLLLVMPLIIIYVLLYLFNLFITVVSGGMMMFRL
jgi:hypothetical protein